MDKTLKLLLIEDNPGDTFLIKFYLEESKTTKYKITHVDFLSSALKMIDKNAYDLVLLDLNLPDSMGIGTLAEILKSKRDLLVIVLTGVSDENLGIKAVQLGANDFLTKGKFDSMLLNSSIRYAFERTRLKLSVKKFSNEAEYYREKCEQIQAMASIGYWELDLNDSMMKWSESLMRIIGKKRNSKTDLKHFIESFSVADREKIKSLLIRRAMSKPVSIEVKLANRKKVSFLIEKKRWNRGEPMSICGLIKAA